MLAAILRSSRSDPDGALVLGTGAGVWLFFRGFRVFRKYQLVADTPQIPIRSIPMGLVKVRGKATAEETVASPVSRTPCYFYKVKIERWKSGEHGGGEWQNYCTDLGGRVFYLQDDTGKVKVDAHQAELDVPEVATNTADSSHSGEANAELLRYVGSAGANRIVRFAQDRLARHATADNAQQSAARSTLLAGLSAASSFLEGDPKQIAPAIEQFLQARTPLADPVREQLFQAEAEHFRQMALAGSLPLQGSPPSGRFRLTEYCVLPGESYEITGTCCENPEAADDHDRNRIAKGEHEHTFLISSKPEQQLESGLRRNAMLMIFGGAALTLVCLALLMARYKMF